MLPETLFRAQGKNLGSALKGKDGIGLLSPGGVSKRVNVVCNESGSFSIMSLTGIALTIPTRYGILVETISSYSVALLRLVTVCRAEKVRSKYCVREPGNLIKLGGGGNGPSFMFAGQREYGA